MGIFDGIFDGYNATVSERNDGKSDIFYGGSAGNTPGDGHGHVVTNPGGGVDYWREPSSAGGSVLVDYNYNPDNPHQSEPRW